MVLSNKKLKQKLRSLLAESIAATESKKSRKDASSGDVNQQLQSVKELLESKSRKPRLSKREKRRDKPPFSKDSEPVEGSEETQKGNGESVAHSVGLKNKEKSKKRKREGVDEGEGAEGLREKKPNKKKKQKKKRDERKEKKKRKEEKDEGNGEKSEKGTESTNGESNENGIEESIKIDESEPKKVYVGGIPYYSTEDDIRSFFEGCGTVTEADCMRFPETGKFRGIAILAFKTEAAAKRALALDGADMGGFYLKIQPYKANRTQKSDFAPEIVDGYNRAYVGNLSWDITEDDLKQFLSDCKVSTIRFGMDKETGDFKGYAHVDFSDSVSLAIALKLDQKVLCGRPVRIRCAVPKKGGETTDSSKKSGCQKVEDGQSVGSSKKKRRTCYECGVPGHLSSACPRKKTVEVDGSSVKS